MPEDDGREQEPDPNGDRSVLEVVGVISMIC